MMYSPLTQNTGTHAPMLRQTIKVILASLSLGALSQPAWAQHGSTPEAPQTNAERIYLESDTLVYDEINQRYIAEGNVYIESENRRVRADSVIYNITTKRVQAIGHVEYHQGQQPAQYADELELNEDLSEGIAQGFATLMEQNGQAASAFAIRNSDGSTELSNAYYTACRLCADGNKPPTWRLRASRVVQDPDEEMIYYRNARLEVFGAPVLYTPVFAHPDPSTPRKSGFLIPDLDRSKRLGIITQVPYLWVISPNQDLVISPRYTQELNPLLEFQHRKRFYSGSIRGEYSITYEQEFGDAARLREIRSPFAPSLNKTGLHKYGAEEARWHAFVEGGFSISPGWRWGFGLQETSGDLYLRRYDYDEMPQFESTLIPSENRRLISQLYLTGRGDSYYTSAVVARHRSLIEWENDDTLPQMLPAIEAFWDSGLPSWMGDLNTQLAFANLVREDGDDYMRASLGIDWSRPTYAFGGARVEMFALGRLDAYKVTRFDASGLADDQNLTRHLGAGGVDIKYPFIQPHRWGHVMVSPRIQARVSGGLDDNQPLILEDSSSLDLDRSTLFARNRAAGFDVWEDGAYLDYGAEVSLAHYAQNIELEFFAGRSYRMEGETPFGAASGFELSQSDYVTEISVDTGPFSTSARARIDEDNGELNRLDLNSTVSFWRVRMNANYTRQTDEALLNPSEEILGAIDFKVNHNFTVGYNATHDVERGITRRQQAHVTYRDECSEFIISWEREDFQIGELGPTSSIKFRFNLFTLGGFGGE